MDCLLIYRVSTKNILPFKKHETTRKTQAGPNAMDDRTKLIATNT